MTFYRKQPQPQPKTKIRLRCSIGGHKDEVSDLPDFSFRLEEVEVDARLAQSWIESGVAEAAQ
jgi:hypothetical protein